MDYLKTSSQKVTSKVTSKVAKNLFKTKTSYYDILNGYWNTSKGLLLSVDQQFFITSALIISLVQIPALLLSLFKITHKLADPAFVLSFIGVVATTLLLRGTYYLRQLIISSMVIVWGVRLGSFLTYRSLHGKDWRLEALMNRDSNIVNFYIFQALLTWTTCLPLILLNSSVHNPAMGLRDMLGYAIWGLGFLMETVADWQKYQYHQKHKDRFCSVGLWGHSRHPNFFGEILQWWGIFISVSPVLNEGWSWLLGLMGPLALTSCIVFLSGIPPLERRDDLRFGKDAAYQRYKANVPILFPSLSCEFVRETTEKLKKGQ